MATEIKIYNEVGWLCPIQICKLKVMLKVMLEAYSLGFITLYIVRDGEIMPINFEQLSCQGPTNILSFPVDSSQNSIDMPHTLILSVDTLQRECMLYGQDIIEHMVRLLAHGLGHLMGYDHGQEMFELCEKMEHLGKTYLQKQI